jgi:hypothetical protein
MPIVADTACISRASVTTVPVKPSSSRSRRIQRRDEQVAGHHRPGAGGDPGPERHQLGGVQLGPRAGHGGHLVVRVGRCGSVSRKVLRAGRDAGPLQALHGGGHLPGGHLRRRAERPHTDHRVARIDVHVGDRGQVQGDPGASQPGSDRGVHRLGRRGVVKEAQRGSPRTGAAALGVQPGDVAALLVQCDDDVAPGRIP